MLPETKAILKNVLFEEESFRSKPYKDTTGNLTIGIGRNLTVRGISLVEGKFLLDNDIEWHDENLQKTLSFYSSLSETRQAVMVDMSFNLGLRGLLGFEDMLGAVKFGDYPKAARCMLDSLWHKQVGMRAENLARAMITDVMV
jgi:lysozyme